MAARNGNNRVISTYGRPWSPAELILFIEREEHPSILVMICDAAGPLPMNDLFRMLP